MTNLSTKQRILLTAEEIMARKGLGATISEIASQSGIKDSVIYHYFKNKEDLLFSIAEAPEKTIAILYFLMGCTLDDLSRIGFCNS